jgi:hypothetical protein
VSARAAGAPGLAATTALVPGVWPGWRALAASAIFVVALWALGGLPPELRELLHFGRRRQAR